MRKFITGKRFGLWIGLGGALILAIALVFPAAAARLPSLTQIATSLPTSVSGLSTQTTATIPITISGTVVDANGPVGGAVLQIKGTPNQTTAGKDGRFTFRGQGLGGATVTTITAWAPGHMVGWVDLDPQKPVWKTGGSGVTITLKPLFTVDNNLYTWFTYEGVSGSKSCGICHREYTEWTADAHSQSAINPRFLTIYHGTNMQGQAGQSTVMGTDGSVLPPDPTKPNYGPGFLLDNPERDGNCATCHAPLGSTTSNQRNCSWLGCHMSITSQNSASLGIMDPGVSIPMVGIGLEGISCEFCHKIGDVILDPKTKLPYPDMPGILSLKLYRPPAGQSVFFGPMLDINRNVSYSTLETQSQYCAACHYGVFGGVVGMGEVTGGTVIYNSYGEWLNSPYSNPTTGKTCQDCHMPVEPNTNFTVFPADGGTNRDYYPFHDHTMTGIEDDNLMKNAVTMKTGASHTGNTLQVQVSITNDKTGHDVPTDEPMRSVMLVVQALDANGKQLAFSQGSALPAWTGNFSGQPGKVFAKVLKDDWTGETPTAAYWRPVTIVEDTRLAPFATDSSTYSFNLQAGNPASIKISLVYRRAYQLLEQQKGWTDADILMAESTIAVEK
ncbi:MAG: carboxypeptidase-like regulatory domain-containing protein [Anaerolineaceae bacterium]|jgi:hypothetical protein